MPIVAQLNGIKAPEASGVSAATNAATATLALSTPMSAGEHAAAKQNLVLAGFSINIGIGGPLFGAVPPPVVVAPPTPFYPSVPTYYDWMGPGYVVAPPPSPGLVVIMHGGRYYNVPRNHWENRWNHWGGHRGRGW
jgi:hypothetical protein